jgi:hypothetical protein
MNNEHQKIVLDRIQKSKTNLNRMLNWDSMICKLEEVADIQSYDKFKRNDDGKRVLFSDYLRKRKLKK